MPDPVNLDAKLENADWTKGSWDLGITTREELYAYLRGRGLSLAAFKRLPVYRHAQAAGTLPGALRDL